MTFHNRDTSLILITIFIFILSFLSVTDAADVYVILGSDTSIWWNTDGGDDAYTYANEFDFDVFSNPTGVFYDVFDVSFRNAHTDSFGQPFKFTWYMHGGGWFLNGTNSNAITTTYLIKKHWGDELEFWGDEMAYHFHHFVWNGSRYAMAPTFAETIWDYEWTASQMLIDEGVYPVSFRSGWNYMDNPYQQYLENWIPFRMEGGGWMATSTPYHPSYSSYQVAGTMKGWEVRHLHLTGLTTSFANNLFDTAAGGTDQVICLWSHQNESSFIQQIANVDQVLHAAASTHPGVNFHYCTGKEAMNKYTATTDYTPPALSLNTTKIGNTVNVDIMTETDIYQTQPWVAARKYNGEYIRLDASDLGGGLWGVSYTADEIDKVTVAVCDINGNVSTEEARDGSEAWSTQSEFHHSQNEDVDLEAAVDRAVLAVSGTPVPYFEQTDSDSQTDILHRAYWIGQTFIPAAAGVSKVTFGVKVNSPADYLVELRESAPDGFPNDNPDGLLASGTASFSTTGMETAWLNYSGLVLDGRSYVLVFKLISGDGEILLDTTDPYPDGLLIRAYSLDWITIPAFDCQFQVYDISETLVIDQPSSNGDAYNSERGYIISQTFQVTDIDLAGIELNLAASLSSEILGIQLRKTLIDGSPDYSYNAIIEKKEISITGPGIQYLPLGWTIPDIHLNETLALTITAPNGGRNSIRLAYDANNPYASGELFYSDDLVNNGELSGSDLYFRLFGIKYISTGNLVFEYDAEDIASWTSAAVSLDEQPAGTGFTVRYRFGNTESELNLASWSGYFATTPVIFPTPSDFRMIQVEVGLNTTELDETPVFDNLEVFYEGTPLTGIEPTEWSLYK